MPLSPYRVLKQFGYAMYFDGVDDYVSLPSVVRQYGAHTIEVWIYPVSWRSHDGLFGGRGLDAPTARGGIALTRYAGNNNLYYDVYSSTNRYAVRTPVPTAGVWTCITASYNNSVMALYYNAVLRASASVGSITIDWSGTARTAIGFSGWSYFNGFISAFRIYSRALSDSEVRWNYLYSNNPVRNGLVLWLQADPNNVKDVDGDGIPEWVDLSGYGNHGKIYGATLVQLLKPSTRVLASVRTLPPVR
jgi:hypothetical protein